MSAILPRVVPTAARLDHKNRHIGAVQSALDSAFNSEKIRYVKIAFVAF